MPDPDFNPKNPKDYHMFHNWVVDKLCGFDLNSSETRIFFSIVRKTWGYESQPWAEIRWRTFAKMTGMKPGHISRTLTRLVARRVILRRQGKIYQKYKVNSKLSQWLTWSEVKQVLPKWVTRKVLPNQVTEVLPNQVTEVLPNQVTIPIKDTYYKDTYLKHTKERVCVMNENDIKIEDAKTVIDCLNELSGKEFSYDEINLEPIIERFDSGATIDQCMTVCFNKWEDPTFQNQFYRPSTLFKKAHFENYLNSKGTKFKPSSKQELRRYNNAKVFYERELERRKREAKIQRDCEEGEV